MLNQQKSCFFIAPIGEAGSAVRDRSDAVLEYIVAPAVEKHGFEVIRADLISKPGSINSQVIEYIINSDLVIADLTSHNPNVFYELGIRHTIRKPVIQIIDCNDLIPFDLASIRTIRFNHQDLRSAHHCSEEISRQILSILSNDGTFDSPVSASYNLTALSASENPLEKSLLEIINGIQQISLEMETLKRNGLAGQSWPLDDTYSVGDIVVHPAFGRGKVIRLIGAGRKACICVNFSGLGQKVLDLRFAPLNRIAGPDEIDEEDEFLKF